MKINKTYVLNNKNYCWLSAKMDPSFEIEVYGKSKIIFGFNGIGKTSFVNCLRDDSNLNLRFLDYENMPYDSNDTTITIATNMKKIEEIKTIIDEKSREIDWNGFSKFNGFKKSKNKEDPFFVAQYKKELKSSTFVSSVKKTKNEYNKFIKKYKDISPSAFFSIINYLKSLVSIDAELEGFKNQMYVEFLDNAKSFIDGSNKCPVCGTIIDNLCEKIELTKEKLIAKKSFIIKALEDGGQSYDKKTIDLYLSLYKEFLNDSDLFNDYVVCGNDIEKHSLIEKNTQIIAKEELELSILNFVKEKKYKEIKQKENLFKRDISKYLKISQTSITFDDSKKQIVIKLDRETSKYSTGERHILWFLAEMYSFLGSDSRTLVLDDPASSIDLVNMYKIAFEIVKNSKIENKNMLIFSHSVEFINIINSQQIGALDVYYIEEINNLIYCDKIYYMNSEDANIFTIKRILDIKPKIIKSLKKKDDENDDIESEVYHYDLVEHFSNVDKNGLSNYVLVNLIDNFEGFSKNNFYSDVFTKIYHLVALRVWLEKSLFSLIPSNDIKRQNDFLRKKTIQQKITIVEKEPSYLTVSKDEINSKKVMLNQNVHYSSQVMPFAYAMNISFDDLKKEIEELKELFNSKND